MKKIAIAVAATLALSMAAPAFAAMQMTGKMTGGYTVRGGDVTNMNPAHNGSLFINAKEDGGWTAEAELKDLSSAAKFGPYKVEFRDPRFQLMLWGRSKETSAKSDPLAFIESAKKHTGVLKARAGVGPVVVDMQDDGHGFLFAEKAIAGHTLGVVSHGQLPVMKNGVTVLGYDRTKVANIAIDAELGMTTGQTENYVGYGVKAVAPLMPNVTGSVSYKARPVNFDVTNNDNQGVNELYTEAKYEASGMKLVGSMTDLTGTKTSRTLAANATVSGIEAGVSHVTDLTENPTDALTLKHSRQINPVFGVTGNVELKSDKDGVTYKQKSLRDVDDTVYFTSPAYAKMQLDGKYTGIAKLTVEPAMTMVMGKNDKSYVRFGSKAGYQVSPNGKLTAEYGRDHVNGNFNDAKVAAGYEVKF